VTRAGSVGVWLWADRSGLTGQPSRCWRWSLTRWPDLGRGPGPSPSGTGQSRAGIHSPGRGHAFPPEQAGPHEVGEIGQRRSPRAEPVQTGASLGWVV